MSTGNQPCAVNELLRQANAAYYDRGDDKTCARLLWEATFHSVQQAARRMGYPCEDTTQATEFARFLDREHSDKIRHAYAMLFFGLGMLDHAEGGEWSTDPEFAWTFPEFPMVIDETTEIVETFSDLAEVVSS